MSEYTSEQLSKKANSFIRLRDIETFACTVMFVKIFGNIGIHLYSKFTQYDRDILALIPTLDYANLKALFDYIES